MKTMATVFFLLALAAIATIVLPIVAIAVAQSAKGDTATLARRVETLREQLLREKEAADALSARVAALEGSGTDRPDPPRDMRPADGFGEAQKSLAAPHIARTALPEAKAPTTAPRPAPLPDAVTAQPPRAVTKLETAPGTAPRAHESAPPARPPEIARRISLEQFMGAKLFAWVGGLALFLGIIFFVKLSIDRGWISPELRTAIGFIIGGGLVGGGFLLNRRERYSTLAQTLCATGSVILYGVTYAAHAFYRIAFFAQPIAAFSAMALITAGAFLLAVRMRAQVVAILGMLGGFLAPFLCSTGQDNPLALFGYIALLDVGVLAVAKARRWFYLSALAATGTALTQFVWMGKFFRTATYGSGAATWIPIGIFWGFAALFAFAAWRSGRRAEKYSFAAGAAFALCASAMLAAFVFLGFASVATRPETLYVFVLGVNLLTLALAWVYPRVTVAQAVLGTLTFAHLSIWTASWLTGELLPYALGVYLIFGLLHTGFALACQKSGRATSKYAAWVPIASLVLLALPFFRLHEVSLWIWPAILLASLLVLALALAARALAPVLAALALTMLSAAVWLLGLSQGEPRELWPFLAVLTVFGFLFNAAFGWATRKNRDTSPVFPLSAGLMPFALLVLATTHVALRNPSPVFGAALLLALLLLASARYAGTASLAPTALLGVLGVEWAWHLQHLYFGAPGLALAWYLGFYALFMAYPVVFRRSFSECRWPWITAAAAGVGTFFPVYETVRGAWPNWPMGLLALGFAVAPLALFAYACKSHAPSSARLTQLAWLGGAALFFVTLAIPLQFEKQWITLGWALEGAALCALFRRVPHPGLRALGTALLASAFVRLAFNPLLLEYHSRSAAPILNWYLYTYVVASLAMFGAAAALGEDKKMWGGVNLAAAFRAMGGVLLFVLLNIEIADAFTSPGSARIDFSFGGNFARDMAYTIGWAVFALALLVVGIWRRSAPTRYAGIGLLAGALLKLFFHDLTSIESIYRIAALISVALIALAVSFLYQRFLAGKEP